MQVNTKPFPFNCINMRFSNEANSGWPAKNRPNLLLEIGAMNY
jgi:hypothetical protein